MWVCAPGRDASPRHNTNRSSSALLRLHGVHPVRLLSDVRRFSPESSWQIIRCTCCICIAREAALRELLVPVPVTAPAPESSPMERDLLGDHDDGEVEEMVLATPLQRTVPLNPEDIWPGWLCDIYLSSSFSSLESRVTVEHCIRRSVPT